MSGDSYSIERLNIRLPSGMQTRADRIARSTAEALSHIEPDRSVSQPTINVPVVRIQPGETDFVIARRIAASINASIFDDHQWGRTSE